MMNYHDDIWPPIWPHAVYMTCSRLDPSCLSFAWVKLFCLHLRLTLFILYTCFRYARQFPSTMGAIILDFYFVTVAPHWRHPNLDFWMSLWVIVFSHHQFNDVLLRPLSDVCRVIELLDRLQRSGELPPPKLQALQRVLQSKFCAAIREVRKYLVLRVAIGVRGSQTAFETCDVRKGSSSQPRRGSVKLVWRFVRGWHEQIYPKVPSELGSTIWMYQWEILHGICWGQKILLLSQIKSTVWSLGPWFLHKTVVKLKEAKWDCFLNPKSTWRIKSNSMHTIYIGFNHNPKK